MLTQPCRATQYHLVPATLSIQLRLFPPFKHQLGLDSRGTDHRSRPEELALLSCLVSGRLGSCAIKCHVQQRLRSEKSSFSLHQALDIFLTANRAHQHRVGLASTVLELGLCELDLLRTFRLFDAIIIETQFCVDTKRHGPSEHWHRTIACIVDSLRHRSSVEVLRNSRPLTCEIVSDLTSRFI